MKYRNVLIRETVECCKAAAFAIPVVRSMRLRRGRYHTADKFLNWQTYCETPWLVLRTALERRAIDPRGLTLLEIGPGDFVGVGIHWLALGGARYFAIDRFPSPVFSSPSIEAYKEIVPDPRQLAAILSQIEYHAVTIEQLAVQTRARFDVIFSHRAMQHVSDLDSAFRAMRMLLGPGTTCVHYWDFGGCGISHGYPHEFLDIPSTIYRLIYASRGYPNRISLSGVKHLASRHGMEAEVMSVVEYSPEELSASRGKLKRKDITESDLRVKEALLSFRLMRA